MGRYKTWDYPPPEPLLKMSIKDAMAISGISESTAKRRLREIDRRRVLRIPYTYCHKYSADKAAAEAYIIGKRYDMLHCFRIKRKAHPPYSYEIRTWEEAYYYNGVHKIRFHELVLFEPDGRRVSGTVRYFTVPDIFVPSHKYCRLPLLTEFMERAMPTDRFDELLRFYGLMVLKRVDQKRVGFISSIEVNENRLVYLSHILRKTLRNTKKIWFCKLNIMPGETLAELGFREIEGSGFAVAGVPGYDRHGKVQVWLNWEE